MSKFKIYAKSILIPLIFGGIVGLIISGSMNYDELAKPPFSPPSIVFPIVWSILYVLMGISYGILESNNQVDRCVNFVYYSQLIVNLLWPIAFFVFEWRLFAFVWILLLDVLAFIMALVFYGNNKLAGLLQIPYLVWLLFASYLNLGVYLLNIKI